MKIEDFINIHQGKNQIHLLDKQTYWVSCVYNTRNITFYKKIPPTEVQLNVGLNAANRYYIRINKMSKEGKVLKTTFNQSDNQGNALFIFQSKKEAVLNYNIMLDTVKRTAITRRDKINNFIEDIDKEYK